MSYQKASSRLLIRPKANPEESFQSYLIRLSKANGYKYSAFSSGITTNSKPHRSFKPEDRDDIRALVSNIADCDVSNLVDVWECGFYTKHLFDYSRIKVCPKCYESKQFLPAYWWLKNYLVCDEHKLLLIDSCSACNTRYTEESFVQGHCLECGLEIEHNESTELNSGIFDKTLHSLCSDTCKSPVQFKELITDEVEQIYVHHQICSYLLKEIQGQDKYTNHRRTLGIDELYSVQKDIQKIVKDGTIRQLMYEALRAYRRSTGNGIPSFMTPIFDSLMSSKGGLYKAELINMLIEEPNDLGDWSIGLNWIEKLLSIEANALKIFVKNCIPNLEVKSQGPFAVLIRDLNFILSEYYKQAPTFKLP